MVDTASADLVVRLLGAIDEREQQHHAVAEELRQAARWKMHVSYASYIRASVQDGLRLRQAHQDLVAEWQKQAQIRDQLAIEAKGSEEHLTALGVVAGLWTAVTLVARGYGLEEA